MSLKNAYREQMEARLGEQRARLELLKAQAKHAVATGKVLAYEELADAETKLAATSAKLKELGAASEEAWGDLKGGVEKAWHALAESANHAADKFKSGRH